ncbi:hypothetical protein [Helicobacter sp. T3_23-1059]
MPKLRFFALFLLLTLNVANAMTLDYIRNHSNIEDRYEWGDFFYQNKQILSMASLESNMIRTRFEFKQKDLLLLKELANLQDKDYNAFGIPLPKQIILEVLNFHKNHNDEFSMLVKAYPFSQLIFSQWQTIKLYEKHKELTQNPKLTYKDFMRQYFSFTYNGKNLNIYEAIAKMKLQERNNANDENYSIISNYVALADYDAITLYDFVYDIIPNSIKREFLKDESTMKAYLPLKSESFEYTQNNFKDKTKLHANIYGDKPFNEKNIKKEWHTINALNLKGYDINSKEILIPKVKHNKLGIVYDEIWELVNNKKPTLLEITQEMIDEEDKINQMLIRGDINDDYTKSALEIEYNKRLAQNTALLIGNNFAYDKAMFESLRVVLREAQRRFDKGELSKEEMRYHYDMSGLARYSDEFPRDWYGFELRDDCYYAYRFNQALALAFVGAYHKGE